MTENTTETGDEIGFAPYQTTIGEIEITLTSEHGDHIKEQVPLEDQLILEIAKSGQTYREIFEDLHADEITELREALEDIERIFHEAEKHQTHAWQCTNCGQTLITEGRPDTCECGTEDWERDEEIEQLSDTATSVLQHLYVLDPGESVRKGGLTARLEAEMDTDRTTIADGLEELLETEILETTDDGIQRY